MFILKGLSNNFLKNVPVSVNSVYMRNKVTLPDLPYDYKALEPIVSREIMELHHSKHHAAYVNNYNLIEEKIQDATAKGDQKVVSELARNFKFNEGGHVNHTIFWQNLTPTSNSGKPTGKLEQAINKSFGSFDNFKTQISALAVGVHGSGWAWLGYNTKSKELNLATCGNQDMLLPTTGLIPLFGIDVWEHAYYLQYKNLRPDYVKAIFEVANWSDVLKRYEDAVNA